MIIKFMDENNTVIQTEKIYYTERIMTLMIGVAFEKDKKQCHIFLSYDDEKKLLEDLVNITEEKLQIV